MIEFRIGYSEYTRDDIEKFIPICTKLNKIKSFIQIGENRFILSDDIGKVNLVDKSYKLFYNRVDDVLVARFN